MAFVSPRLIVIVCLLIMPAAPPMESVICL